MVTGVVLLRLVFTNNVRTYISSMELRANDCRRVFADNAVFADIVHQQHVIAGMALAVVFSRTPYVHQQHIPCMGLRANASLFFFSIFDVAMKYMGGPFRVS